MPRQEMLYIPTAITAEQVVLTDEIRSGISNEIRTHLANVELDSEKAQQIATDYIAYLDSLNFSLVAHNDQKLISCEYFLAKKIAAKVAQFDPQYTNPNDNASVRVQMPNVAVENDTDDSSDLHQLHMNAEYTEELSTKISLRDLAHYYFELDDKVAEELYKSLQI